LKRRSNWRCRINRALKIARLKVDEAGHKREGARADYFPKLIGLANYQYFNERLGTTVTAGELGLNWAACDAARGPDPH